MLLISLLQAIFGTSIPLGKMLLGFTSPIFLAGLRMFLAGVILIGYSYIFQRQHFSFKRVHVWPFVQIMIFGIYLKYVLRYWGLNYLTSAKMSFLLNATPFVAAFFSYIFFKEKLSNKKWIGLCLGFAGFIPILLSTSRAEELVGNFFIFSWPEIAIFVGVICHCYGLVIARKLIRDENYSASMVNGIRTFGGGFLAIITAFFIEGFSPIHNISEFIFWLFVLIFISNIICHNLYLHLLKRYSITFLSFSDFLSPIFTACWGWLFLNESVTWHFYVSSIIVFFGLYIFYQDELAKEISIQPATLFSFYPKATVVAKEKQKEI